MESGVWEPHLQQLTRYPISAHQLDVGILDINPSDLDNAFSREIEGG